jgi:hypothetical protein
VTLGGSRKASALARVFFGRKAFTPPKAFTATVVAALRVSGLRILVTLLMASVLITGCQHAQAAKPASAKPAPLPYTIKEIRYCFS